MSNLEEISNQACHDLEARDAAREKMLPLCREVIRCSGNAIRAIHRQEYRQAAELLESARGHLINAVKAVENYSEFISTGIIRDAQKELAEANVTLAIVTRKALPGPRDLNIDSAAYLNGMGEAIGELRRYLLDGMRKGDLSRGEELLSMMDDIYSVLVTIDFPDAITGGLRRTTDMVRGVLEKTRSDLTLAIQQKALEAKLAAMRNEEFSVPNNTAEEPVQEDTQVQISEPEDAAASHGDEPVLDSNEMLIYKALDTWRDKRSTEENVAPLIIARNSTLKRIIKARPTTTRDMMTIKGLGERWVNKYGKDIIAVISATSIQ